MIGYLYCVCFIIIYYLICFFPILSKDNMGNIRKIYYAKFKIKVLYYILFFMCILITWYWISQDKYIYFWDYSGYWMSSVRQMKYIFSGTETITGYIHSLITSVNQDTYNIFLPTVISLPLHIFGYSYKIYVMINEIFFLIPAVIVQGMAAIKILKEKVSVDKAFLIGIIVPILTPANYFALLRGYIDVALLLPISVLIYILLDYDWTKKNYKSNVSIALLFVILWISRRYSIYFIIGYLAALILCAFCYVYREKRGQAVLNVLINIGEIGGVSLGILFIFFRNFILNAFFTDYGEMYSAYGDNFFSEIYDVCSFYGLLVLALLVVAFITALYTKKYRVELMALYILLIVESLLFFQTQAMGWHHKLILSVPITMSIVIWVNMLIENKIYKKVLLIISSVLLVVNYATALIPIGLNTMALVPFFTYAYTPLQRDDIQTLGDMVNYLNSITEGTDDGVYVAASGYTLNNSLLICYDLPYSECAVPNVTSVTDVDLRDGFSDSFLSDRYVVTTIPTDTHLDSGQEVVKFISKEITDSESNVGKHYRMINSFQLDNNVVAYVYEKISEYSEDDLRYICDYFAKLYPGYEELFAERIKNYEAK